VRLQPDHLIEAARERPVQAWALFHRRDYAPAMFVAGVGVECLLRGFILRRTNVLETGHDIPLLFRESRIKPLAIERQEAVGLSEAGLNRYSRQWDTALATMSSRWSNDFRYASESRLRAHLKRMGLDRGVRGDFARFQARRLIEAAEWAISEGSQLWEPSAGKWPDS